jgi:hypothetical protein
VFAGLAPVRWRARANAQDAAERVAYEIETHSNIDVRDIHRLQALDNETLGSPASTQMKANVIP